MYRWYWKGNTYFSTETNWYFNTNTPSSPDEQLLSLACDCLVSPQSLSVERICVTWLVGPRHQPRADWLITRSPLLLPVKQTHKISFSLTSLNMFQRLFRSQLLHSVSSNETMGLITISWCHCSNEIRDNGRISRRVPAMAALFVSLLSSALYCLTLTMMQRGNNINSNGSLRNHNTLLFRVSAWY